MKKLPHCKIIVEKKDWNNTTQEWENIKFSIKPSLIEKVDYTNQQLWWFDGQLSRTVSPHVKEDGTIDYYPDKVFNVENLKDCKLIGTLILKDGTKIEHF